MGRAEDRGQHSRLPPAEQALWTAPIGRTFVCPVLPGSVRENLASTSTQLQTAPVRPVLPARGPGQTKVRPTLA
jgi:hypothetical protein